MKSGFIIKISYNFNNNETVEWHKNFWWNRTFHLLFLLLLQLLLLLHCLIISFLTMMPLKSLTTHLLINPPRLKSSSLCLFVPFLAVLLISFINMFETSRDFIIFKIFCICLWQIIQVLPLICIFFYISASAAEASAIKPKWNNMVLARTAFTLLLGPANLLNTASRKHLDRIILDIFASFSLILVDKLLLETYFIFIFFIFLVFFLLLVIIHAACLHNIAPLFFMSIILLCLIVYLLT